MSPVQRVYGPRDGVQPEVLAFYPATHGFDATLENGNVEVELGGEAYKFIPNGSALGLANIMA